MLADHTDHGVVTSFWDEQVDTLNHDPRGPKHQARVMAFRKRIEATQSPTDCSRVPHCACAAWGGGMLSLIHGSMNCLLAAVLRGCALVYDEGNMRLGRYITSAALLHRCNSTGRMSGQCYFQPISTCGARLLTAGAPDPRRQMMVAPSGIPTIRVVPTMRPLTLKNGKSARRDECNAFKARTKLPGKKRWRLSDCTHLGLLLDQVYGEYGLESDLLIRATLLAWMV